MAVFNFTRQNNEDCKQGSTFEREIVLRDENNVIIPIDGYTEASIKKMKKPQPIMLKCYKCQKEKGHLFGSLRRRERFCSLDCFNEYWDKAIKEAVDVGQCNQK
jgi:hypothetical protein